MLSPAPALEGADQADTTRSAPTCSQREARLFTSEVSGTLSPASALAITYQPPVAVPAGTVSAVEAVLLAPAARTGTLRSPSGTSAASSAVSTDRK
jgi:hypothetical protein